MPSWKKVIVSGSDASLNNLSASTVCTTGNIRGSVICATSCFVGNFCGNATTATSSTTATTAGNSNCLGSAPQVCYVMTCGNQTVAGVKTFSSCIVASGGVCGVASSAVTATTATTAGNSNCLGSAPQVCYVMMCGNQTVGGVKTFSGTVCGSGLIRAVNLCATTSICGPLVVSSGTSRAANLCATTSICGPMICVSGTATANVVCGVSSVCSNNGAFSGCVTVGPISPSGILTVSGSGTVLDIQGTQGQLFSITDCLTGVLMSVNDISGLPILEVSSDDKVVMGTFGQNTLVVTGSNVGIGTPSPEAKLAVGSGVHESATFSVRGESGVGTIANFRDENGENIFKTVGSVASATLEVSFGDIDYAGSGNYFKVTDSKTYFMEGNVGIGTTNPGCTLSVVGAICSSAQIRGTSIITAGTVCAGSNIYGGVICSNSCFVGNFCGNATTATSATTATTAGNSNCLGSAPQVCYTMNCGNQTVGGVKTFSSCIVASGGVCGVASSAVTATTATTAGNSNCLGSAPQVCYVMMCGNQTIAGIKTFSSDVLISKSSPNLCLNATAAGSATLVLTPNSTGGTGGIINVNSATLPLILQTNSGERMRITAGGTLLLSGSVTPFEPAWKGTAVFGPDGQDKVIIGGLVSSYTGATIGGHNSALSAWCDLNIVGGNIIFRYQETEYARINTSGNVGIGTTSPGCTLSVVGTGCISGELRVGTINSAGNISLGGEIQPTACLLIRTLGTIRACIDAAGICTGGIVRGNHICGITSICSALIVSSGTNRGANLCATTSICGPLIVSSGTNRGANLCATTTVCSPRGVFSACVDSCIYTSNAGGGGVQTGTTETNNIFFDDPINGGTWYYTLHGGLSTNRNLL